METVFLLTMKTMQAIQTMAVSCKNLLVVKSVAEFPETKLQLPGGPPIGPPGGHVGPPGAPIGPPGPPGGPIGDDTVFMLVVGGAIGARVVLPMMGTQ